MFNELPVKLKTILNGFQVEKSKFGLSIAGVYQFKNKELSYHLKYMGVKDLMIKELEIEFKLLKWIEGKFLAPIVVDFYKNDNNHYLLMTTLNGYNLEEIEMEISEKIILYAEILKELHSLNYINCPIKVTDYDMLETAKRNMMNSKIDNLEQEYQNLSPSELYELALTLKPEKEELVFTHGDYCMDNIIINDGKLSGIIDIGRGGVSDRYKDIALAIRSIRHDFGEEWINLFLETYGLVDPNWEKIKFYIILDEFY